MNPRRCAALGLALALVVGAACTATKSDDDATAAAGDGGAVGPTTTVPPDQPAATAPTTAPIDVAAASVQLSPVVELAEPTAFAARAGDAAVYIAERGGRVRRIAITSRQNGVPTYTLERTPTLDISASVVTAGAEQGLLGIAFNTDGNRLYVAYTGEDQNQHLDEYRMNIGVAERQTRRELLVVRDFAENHNGGMLAFGPDGFLYWAMGDGGGGGDPEGTGQNPTDLLGSILRIDPDVAPEAAAAGATYAIPDGNPFRDGVNGAPEVWALGLRNPWRFSFDRATGDLWVADVGQGDVEEINFLPAFGTAAGRGANLGWSLREGDQPFNGQEAPPGAVEPILTYGHGTGGCSVTGGYVYRGAGIPALNGAYVWGDYCLGQLHALVVRDNAVVAERDLGLNVPQLSSFGQDNDGELWVLSLAGPVYRLVPR